MMRFTKACLLFSVSVIAAGAISTALAESVPVEFHNVNVKGGVYQGHLLTGEVQLVNSKTKVPLSKKIQPKSTEVYDLESGGAYYVQAVHADGSQATQICTIYPESDTSPFWNDAMPWASDTSVSCVH
jgi:hypothetical protein